MHEEIKKFALEGIVGDDANLVRYKEHLIKTLEDQMRDAGYVPVLDMDPQFTLNYDIDHDRYDFALSIYAVDVGKDNSWETAGLMTGKPIMKHITNPKLKQ